MPQLCDQLVLCHELSIPPWARAFASSKWIYIILLTVDLLEKKGSESSEQTNIYLHLEMRMIIWRSNN
jgi:hypothetical protein